MKKIVILLVMVIGILLVGCKKEEKEPIKDKWVEVIVVDYYTGYYLLNGTRQERAYLVVQKDGKKYSVKTEENPLTIEIRFKKNSKLEVKEKELKPYAG